MMVRFATTCDFCLARSREYEAWPRCAECFRHACPGCDIPKRRTDADLGKPEETLCRECAASEANEILK
jgi:hypothetical protein